MSGHPGSIIETIVGMMNEREKAKKAKWIRKRSLSHDLDMIIDSADYYIRANLWLLQSFNNNTRTEVKI